MLFKIERRSEFYIMKESEDLEIPLRDVSLSRVTSLRALFRMYGSDYSCVTLSVTVQTGISADDVTKTSTDRIIVGHQIPNNGKKLLVLDGRHRQDALRQLYVECNVCRIQ